MLSSVPEAAPEEDSRMLEKLAQAVIRGDVAGAKDFTRAALEASVPPARIIADGLIGGMDVVGKKFREGSMFMPEVLLSARAMHQAMDIVKPLVAAGDLGVAGKVVIGTVKGDLHDIGKKLVTMMLQGAGFEVLDLGVDVGPERFVAAVREDGANVVAMSAMLTTTMVQMITVVRALEQAGLRERVKVIVGGAPVTDEFATEIGADRYGSDAAEAVEITRSLLNGQAVSRETSPAAV